MYNVHHFNSKPRTLHTARSTLHEGLKCNSISKPCTMHEVHCTKYIARYTLPIARCTLHEGLKCNSISNTARSTLHIAHCTLHEVRCTLYIARSTIHEGLKCNSISNTAMTHFTLIWESFSFFRVEAIIRPLHFSFNYTVIHYFHVGIFFSKGSITKSFSHLAS